MSDSLDLPAADPLADLQATVIQLRTDLDAALATIAQLAKDFEDAKGAMSDPIGELAAMGEHALAQHNVSLGTLLAGVIQKVSGVDLHPRLAEAVDANGKPTGQTVPTIGPAAPVAA